MLHLLQGFLQAVALKRHQGSDVGEVGVYHGLHQKRVEGMGVVLQLEVLVHQKEGLARF